MKRLSGESTRLTQAAANLIGAPFRLHGRDPATGIDCVGLVYTSLVAIGRKPVAPEGYRLRNSDTRRWFAAAPLSGFAAADGALEPGDLILIMPAPGQQHLMIVENLQSAIHAHAGLRRVVRQTMAPDLEILAHWRLNPISERKA